MQFEIQFSEQQPYRGPDKGFERDSRYHHRE